MAQDAYRSFINDRSGPFERTQDTLCATQSVDTWLSPTFATSLQSNGRFQSQVHVLEHNPFDSSFEDYSNPYHSSYISVSPIVAQDPPVAGHKHQLSPDTLNSFSNDDTLKRPKMASLKHDSDFSRQASSFGTVVSTATESSAEGSTKDSPPSSAPLSKRNSASGIISPALELSRSASSSDSRFNSAKMVSRRSLPASAKEYEHLMSLYASEHVHQLQAAPKALPSDAMHAIRQALPPSMSRQNSQTLPARLPVIEHLPVNHSAAIAPVVDIMESDPEEGEAAPADSSIVAPQRGKPGRRRGRAAKEKPETREEDEDKRAQFLERNRVAACKSRQKKKDWIAGLEANSEHIARENGILQKTISSLREEVTQLRSALAAHEGCSCQSIQTLKGQQHPQQQNQNVQPGPPIIDSLPPQSSLTVDTSLHYAQALYRPPPMLDPRMQHSPVAAPVHVPISPTDYFPKNGAVDYYPSVNYAHSRSYTTSDLSAFCAN